MGNIIPVILCGGEGRRLWPLSTPEKPKPFHNFGRERSLFGEALARCAAPQFDIRPVIVAAEKNEFLVRAELAASHASAELVLEPCGRNTCAAALAGALSALKRDPDACILVLVADQLMAPLSAFHDAVASAENTSSLGYIVTFGIRPTQPSPEFGYIVPGEALAGSGCRLVRQFREKPDAPQAMSLMAEGALWNSGNFLVKASVLCDLAKIQQPGLLNSVCAAFAGAERTGDRTLLNETAFAAADSVSIDVALLEKARNVAVLAVSLDWCDLGTWASVDASMNPQI